MRHKILYVRAVCSRRYVILDIREVGREINSYRVLYFCDVDRMRSAAGGGAVENVITRRAFSPQLTERTGPEAAGPRNDDTFHEGCNVSAKGSPSTRPVDGSFVYYRDRPTTIDRSIYLSHRGHRVYYVAVPGFISGACRTNRDSDLLSKQSGDVTRRPFLHRHSVVRPNYPSPSSPCRSCHREMISRGNQSRRSPR